MAVRITSGRARFDTLPGHFKRVIPHAVKRLRKSTRSMARPGTGGFGQEAQKPAFSTFSYLEGASSPVAST
jgi:hypothetical protein